MIENINEIETEEFVIDSDQKAEWALRKILEAKAERERLTYLVTLEVDTLKAKQNDIDKRYENDTGFLKAKLSEYMKTVNCKSTKTQSTYQLLSGKLVFKHPELKLKESDGLIDWCKQNAPEYIKHTEEVAWGEIKKNLNITPGGVVLADTGEIVEGVDIIEEPGKFDVKG